jgi:hypothetical protein
MVASTISGNPPHPAVGQFDHHDETWHYPESRLAPVGAWATNTFLTTL